MNGGPKEVGKMYLFCVVLHTLGCEYWSMTPVNNLYAHQWASIKQLSDHAADEKGPFSGSYERQ